MQAVTILVPGFLDNQSTLWRLERDLQRAGIVAQIISPQPSTGEVGIEVLATQLADQIAAMVPPEPPINLFGFSMGGLICRAYLQWFGGLARTRRLVTLATPHNGTYTAYLYDRPACLQMRPGSPFLARLNRDLAQLEQIEFTSIWTPLDLTILPAASSILPVGKMIAILSPFHQALPLDPRVIRLVATCLREPANLAAVNSLQTEQML